MQRELKFKVGDWVIWTLDGDIGIVEEAVSGADEPYRIVWKFDPAASGWHECCKQLELLGGRHGIL